MLYNLVLKYKTRGQKAQTVAEYLRQRYPKIIEVSYNTFRCDDKYRNVCLTQQPVKLVRSVLKEYASAIHFLRPCYLDLGLANKATNGFSVYKAESKYNYFIPMMYDYKNEKKVSELSIGYYFTPYRNNFREFTEFLRQNSKRIYDISILGDTIYRDFCYNILFNINSRFNICFYQDKDEFFSNITHLVFPMSKTFVDPWPTVLEEGVRCGKQIIILRQSRSWKDGVDDICSCIRYHEKLDLATYYDNSDTSILNFNIDKYYNYLFNSNFESYTDRSKFKTFNEFLLGWG